MKTARLMVARVGGLHLLREHWDHVAGNGGCLLVLACPLMHPEIRQDHPGSCPRCAMSLEPAPPSLDDDDASNSERADFSHRFWWTLPFTAAVATLAMAGHWLGWFEPRTQTWIELVLTRPVALWAAGRSLGAARRR